MDARYEKGNASEKAPGFILTMEDFSQYQNRMVLVVRAAQLKPAGDRELKYLVNNPLSTEALKLEEGLDYFFLASTAPEPRHVRVLRRQESALVEGRYYLEYLWLPGHCAVSSIILEPDMEFVKKNYHLFD